MYRYLKHFTHEDDDFTPGCQNLLFYCILILSFVSEKKTPLPVPPTNFGQRTPSIENFGKFEIPHF